MVAFIVSYTKAMRTLRNDSSLTTLSFSNQTKPTSSRLASTCYNVVSYLFNPSR